MEVSQVVVIAASPHLREVARAVERPAQRIKAALRTVEGVLKTPTRPALRVDQVDQPGPVAARLCPKALAGRAAMTPLLSALSRREPATFPPRPARPARDAPSNPRMPGIASAPAAPAAHRPGVAGQPSACG